ncbi:flavocytochrome c [Lactococcus petauri]|uniref:Flavocytochrome c n=1 Tax=Lactococcus petauri TaxID=1940789 RepID=A0ABZ2SG89_9LACT|nr:flavocytochrome c [Lactococcus petauri]OAL08645.1 Fumarate reductase flavoprotein subunit [Lactococcus garvieae]MCI3871679.1 flavocytochrome c [Lactococcus petauri]MCQ8275796.1 Fumarate reductase flavoprotein subunit [Lactococcus petauri]MCR6589612.1 flavocytochrome c [Lactococcus petauri]MCU7363973.1 flavocytochrome c [Lactococcus petauri]
MKRRSRLLAVLGIAALSLTLVACGNNQAASEPEKEADTAAGATKEVSYTPASELKDRYDVVIVGAGGAGMAAALQAQEAGMNPVILEKMPVAGGNTLKSSGGMNASETKFQEKAGIKDSNQLFFNDTLKGGNNTNDQDLLHYLVDNSAEAIDWLDTMGITLDNISYSGGASVKRIHRPTDGSAVGTYLVDGLLRNIQEKEIPLFVNADVKAINGKDGKVTGVKVKIEGQEKEIAGDAVVVTTGGFGSNKELIEEKRPDLKGYVSTTSKGSTGDGIKMIKALGGALVDMDQIQVHPTVVQDTGMLITETVRGEGAILVNQQGKRFFNELETRDNVSAAITALPGSYAYLIFDNALAERAKQLEHYREEGVVVEADTIEELAKKIDMNPEALKTTLDKWNQSVAEQTDKEFGRKTAMDYDLKEGPFCAIQIAPGIHHTMGGVKINTKTQVLKEDGSPITGLYAAGEVTGGIHGQNRIGGNAVADIMVFGRQAGLQAAEYVKAE